MAVNLSPVGGAAAQFFDNSGNVLTGGKLYTYLAGTTTPAITYTQSNGVTAHTNPIVLNAAGRVPDSGEIWLTDSILYKFVLKDSNDVQIAVWDNIDGINSNFVNYTTQNETATATQGQTVFTLASITYQPATDNLAVYVNGSKQIVTLNYIETSATVVTFVDGLNVGDVVQFTTATSVATNVVDASNVAYNEGDTGAVDRNVQSKLQEQVSVLDFGADSTGVDDSTVAFQAAIDTDKTVYVPEGTYNITTVDITMKGCEIVMHEKAYLVITGDGINRDITQLTRADYLTAQGGLAAALAAIDGYNLYDTLKVTGGNIIVEANAIGVSDRIPFLQYIGAAPTPTNPDGLQPFKAAMEISNVSFVLNDSTSIGIGIRGGWGTTVSNCSITGYDAGTAIIINGDGTYNTSSQPQEITIQNNNFNSCTPINAYKGSCTNSCEALNILGNKFNFVKAITLTTVNAANIIGNYIIFNDQSMRIVDSGAVILDGNYLQVAQPAASSTYADVVSFVNSQRAIVTNNEVVINNAAPARNGFGFYTNSVNDYLNIQVSNITFAKAVTGGSAINFAASTAPYTFENITISNIIAPYFSYVVNFFNVVGADARNVTVKDIFTQDGDGTLYKLVGLSRLDLTTANVAQFYEVMYLNLRSSANNSGSAGECLAYTIPTSILSNTFTTTVSAFVNTSNCVSITATNSSGSLRIVLGQAGSVATGGIVSGTATLEVISSEAG